MNSNPEDTEMRNDDADKRPSPNKPYQEKTQDTKLWGVFFFGLIGATVTKFLLNRSQSSWKGPTGGSFRSSFQGEARKRHNRRMQEEYEEEMERVERIKRMQSVFNRERNKNKRSYESWRESGPGVYHQHFQREDWYWKTDTSYRDQRTNFRGTPRDRANYAYSHHYSVLGLDRLRTKPYTDDEIKDLITRGGLAVVEWNVVSMSWIRQTSWLIIRLVSNHHGGLVTVASASWTAFRAKAKEFHPDQNQGNKELAEAKFKEVMTSYEAIKMERKDNKS